MMRIKRGKLGAGTDYGEDRQRLAASEQKGGVLRGARDCTRVECRKLWRFRSCSTSSSSSTSLSWRRGRSPWSRPFRKLWRFPCCNTLIRWSMSLSAREYMREEPKLHLLVVTSVTSLMKRRHPGNFLSIWCQELSGDCQVAQKLETAVPPVCYWSGFSSHLQGECRPRCGVAGFVERGPSAKSTRAELLGE